MLKQQALHVCITDTNAAQENIYRAIIGELFKERTMLIELLFTIIFICFVGGVFYIIQIQNDLIKHPRHSETQNENSFLKEFFIQQMKRTNTPTREEPVNKYSTNENATDMSGQAQNQQFSPPCGSSLNTCPIPPKQPEDPFASLPYSPSFVNPSPFDHKYPQKHELSRPETKIKWNPYSSTADEQDSNKGSKFSQFSSIFGKVLTSINKVTSSDKKDQQQESFEEKYVSGLLKRSTYLENVNTLKVYKLNLKKICCDTSTQLRKFEFGSSNLKKLNDKVIMIVGATGSGKTTLINTMINYVLGVQYEDKFRFRLVTDDTQDEISQAHSQTTWITAYTIHHQKGFKVDYTLTIIDTPGFGDTGGIRRDAEITKQIHNFFTTHGKKGIDHIDVVGFVVQSALPRLTFTQKYIFDQILSLFGKDIGENIYLMLTFADGKDPQVLNGIKEAHMPFKEYFKFNNSVIFDDVSEDEFASMFWQMGMKSFENFFCHFSRIKSKSLTQTRAVLEERERIETKVEGLQFEVKRGLNKLEQLKHEVEVVLQHEADLDRNKDFTYTVNEDIIVKQTLKPNTYVTNCIICNFTCHNPCGIPNDGEKYNCSAMDGGGKSNAKCRVCTKGCSWEQHKNMQYYFTTNRNTVTKTSDDLKKRYQDATGKVKSANQIILEMVNEFEAVQVVILGITEVLRKSINKLNEIALKPNPLSAAEYISILIESEKSSAEPGWQDRVEHLNGVKVKIESLAAIEKQGFDPFEEYKRKIQEERNNTEGVWCAVAGYLQKIQYWKV
ncbi:hypothetical protein LOD99_10916 [Oopsacas minuta]|uniref:Septin-type G domain-containing protein n=1 Tax=Oopsacas minuta TaxID=111878 RepID=A0AAV7KCN2_9METZ|nr:hypothetical protein LOD99_10916 [Oopsacas minuta]